MNILICGSMAASKEMNKIGERLRGRGHKVTLPRRTEEYADGIENKETGAESIKNKIENDLIKKYFLKMKDADCLVVVNVDKDNIKNYIGGNTFLEIGFAHVLNKKIFFLNDIPKLPYRNELIAMKPIILNGNLDKIKKFKEA